MRMRNAPFPFLHVRACSVGELCEFQFSVNFPAIHLYGSTHIIAMAMPLVCLHTHHVYTQYTCSFANQKQQTRLNVIIRLKHSFYYMCILKQTIGTAQSSPFFIVLVLCNITLYHSHVLYCVPACLTVCVCVCVCEGKTVIEFIFLNRKYFALPQSRHYCAFEWVKHFARQNSLFSCLRVMKLHEMGGHSPPPPTVLCD